ncbi:MAG TPA: hypothetical protein VFL15_04260, partial [Gammaproteobacteria bacterium]|nr:hypothetical protein [Gammaproteobacteria bacterium]
NVIEHAARADVGVTGLFKRWNDRCVTYAVTDRGSGSQPAIPGEIGPAPDDRSVELPMLLLTGVPAGRHASCFHSRANQTAVLACRLHRR